ncbi:MAG: hypothetical protein ACI8YO_001940, partial [Gammaproteobacteria bacterium]
MCSCQGVGSAETDGIGELVESNKVILDTRFKVDTIISGMNVKLILNRTDVPVDAYSDFYLKVDDKDPQTVSISTGVSQGIVSQNKEPYYYGIKAKQGVSDIKLMLYYKDDKGERIKI